MKTALTQRLGLAHQLADLSGGVIQRYFRRPHLSSATKTGDVSAIVTQADQEAEARMVDYLQQQQPADGIIREEGENIASQSGYTWVLDPIDGTASFVRGLTIFGTLIGLVDAQMTPVLGIANQPISGDRWQGVQGQTSQCNGQPLHNPYRSRKPAPQPTLADVCLVSTTPLMFTTQAERTLIQTLYQHCQRTAFGGDCLNYLSLAAGWTAMPLVIMEADMNFYDFCALIPILQGAGATISDWQNAPLTARSTQVLATSHPALHQEVIDIIGDSDPNNLSL